MKKWVKDLKGGQTWGTMFATEVTTAEIDCSCKHWYAALIYLKLSQTNWLLEWNYTDNRPDYTSKKQKITQASDLIFKEGDGSLEILHKLKKEKVKEKKTWKI